MMKFVTSIGVLVAFAAADETLAATEETFTAEELCFCEHGTWSPAGTYYD